MDRWIIIMDSLDSFHARAHVHMYAEWISAISGGLMQETPLHVLQIIRKYRHIE